MTKGRKERTALRRFQETMKPRLLDLFCCAGGDRAEQAAREDLAQLKRPGTLGINKPLGIAVDYTIIGAAKLARGAVKFADWSAQMLAEFGEGIRPHLRTVWDNAHAALKSGVTTKEEARKWANGNAIDLARAIEKAGFSETAFTSSDRTEAPAARTQATPTEAQPAIAEKIGKRNLSLMSDDRDVRQMFVNVHAWMQAKVRDAMSWKTALIIIAALLAVASACQLARHYSSLREREVEALEKSARALQDRNKGNPFELSLW